MLYVHLDKCAHSTSPKEVASMGVTKKPSTQKPNKAGTTTKKPSK